jgi:hypothetical protein
VRPRSSRRSQDQRRSERAEQDLAGAERRLLAIGKKSEHAPRSRRTGDSGRRRIARTSTRWCRRAHELGKSRGRLLTGRFRSRNPAGNWATMSPTPFSAARLQQERRRVSAKSSPRFRSMPSVAISRRGHAARPKGPAARRSRRPSGVESEHPIGGVVATDGGTVVRWQRD